MSSDAPSVVKPSDRQPTVRARLVLGPAVVSQRQGGGTEGAGAALVLPRVPDPYRACGDSWVPSVSMASTPSVATVVRAGRMPFDRAASAARTATVSVNEPIGVSHGEANYGFQIRLPVRH